MKARKVKSTFRVIDGIDPWTELESEVSRLESISRVAGDDASVVPSSASSDETKATYLGSIADRIKQAAQKASALGDKERKIAADQAASAIEKARDLQRAIVKPGVDTAYAAADKIDRAEEAVKKLVPWYLAIGVVAWIAIGIIVYEIWESAQKDLPKAKRAVLASKGL